MGCVCVVFNEIADRIQLKLPFFAATTTTIIVGFVVPLVVACISELTFFRYLAFLIRFLFPSFL